ncbi:MAG: type II toxin-antitoxin system prevent-host-death family antitoxin [Planctomycetes bacterium]|nr:type II toxin-antitoxin system prevent-host-death family antitoxin [Planctomycetota bacterium]
MKEIVFGVRELQAHLGRALQAVRDGHRVVITRRDLPVALLVKSDARLPQDSALDRRLRRLAAEGRIFLGRRGRIAPYSLPAGLKGLTEQVLKDRR